MNNKKTLLLILLHLMIFTTCGGGTDNDTQENEGENDNKNEQFENKRKSSRGNKNNRHNNNNNTHRSRQHTSRDTRTNNNNNQNNEENQSQHDGSQNNESHHSGSQQGTQEEENQNQNEVKDEELTELSALCIDIPGFYADQSYFSVCDSMLRGHPKISKFKKIEILHPNFDNKGGSTLEQQAKVILTKIKNAAAYDFIIILGESMGGLVLWFVAEGLISQNLIDKIIIVSFASPDAEVGVPATTNGPAVLKVVSLARSAHPTFVKPSLEGYGLTDENLKMLEDLVTKSEGGFGTILHKENAPPLIKDLRPGSKGLKQAKQLISKHAGSIPCLSIVGTDHKGGFKNMLPFLPPGAYGLASKFICTPNFDKEFDSLLELMPIFTETSFNTAFKNDGLIPAKRYSSKIKVVEIKKYHDHKMSKSGNINGTTYGKEGSTLAINHIWDSMEAKIIKNRS